MIMTCVKLVNAREWTSFINAAQFVLCRKKIERRSFQGNEDMCATWDRRKERAVEKNLYGRPG